MIRILPPCSIIGIRPEIHLGLSILDPIFKIYEEDVELTHGTDGQHSYGSLHYVGQAVDIRSHNFDEARKGLIVDEGKKSLGAQFDFFLENHLTPNEHFHLEFQPK